MNITVKYFAALAEHAGKNQEEKEVSSPSIEELYNELQKTYQFPYTLSEIRVAVNASYVNLSEHLKDNDTVVFITPVAGG